MWIDSRPTAAGYLIGIGSSNTGNEAEDNELARKNALAALAAEIATTIESEVEISESEANGQRSSMVKRRIRENVSQTLEGVEIVGTYYSAESGYWYYCRLPESVLTKQRDELAARVASIVVPAMDGSLTVAESVPVLMKGWELIDSSPYVGTLSLAEYGIDGAAVDAIEGRVRSLAAGASIQAEPVYFEAGRPGMMQASISFADNTPAGPCPLVVTGGRNDAELLRVTTDREGMFQGEVASPRLPFGETPVMVVLDLSSLGLVPEAMYSEIPFPGTSVLFSVEQITVGLDVRAEPLAMIVPGFESQVKSLLASADLPCKFVTGTEAGGSGFQMVATIRFTEYPKVLENAPEIVGAVLSMELLREGRSVYSWESDPIKDGGITKEQARQRTTDKLVQALQNAPGFGEGIRRALQY